MSAAIQCPLCSGYFAVPIIEQHASACVESSPLPSPPANACRADDAGAHVSLRARVFDALVHRSTSRAAAEESHDASSVARAHVSIPSSDFSTLVQRVAAQERAARTNDGQQTYMWFAADDSLAIARVPSLRQLHDDDDDAAAIVTCGYYARYTLEQLTACAPAALEHAFTQLAIVADRRFAARAAKRQCTGAVATARALSLSAPPARALSSSAPTVAVRDALAPLASATCTRSHFVTWYTRALAAQALALTNDDDDDDDVLVLSPRQVARAWPDTCMLVVGNDGLVGTDTDAALAAALANEWPEARRDLERLRALSHGGTLGVLVLVEAHWLAAFVHVHEHRLLVLVADSLDQREFIPLAARAIAAAVYSV